MRNENPGGMEERLSRRQREVAELVARGKTNAEIGAALGISLDGAKYHVSELMVRLNVQSREEIARYWSREQSWSRRVARSSNVALFPGWRFALAGAATIAVAAGALVLWTSFGSETPPTASIAGEPESPTPQASPAPAASVTPVPGGANPTPTVSEEVISATIDDALAELDSAAKVQDVINTVQRGDADALLALTEVTMLAFRDVGPTQVPTVRFNTSRFDVEMARQFLADWLSGNPGEVSFIGTTLPGGTSVPQGPGNELLVHVGFQFRPRLRGDDEPITGIYLFINPLAEDPVVEIWGMVESSPPLQVFRQFTGQESRILLVARWMVDREIADDADFQRRVREAWAAERTATARATPN